MILSVYLLTHSYQVGMGEHSCLWGMLNTTSCFSNIVESIKLKIFSQILKKNYHHASIFKGFLFTYS